MTVVEYLFCESFGSTHGKDPHPALEIVVRAVEQHVRHQYVTYAREILEGLK